MYNEHFRFSETPFTIAPNPRYLYLSAQHREALAHLGYGLGERGGFILLTGDVGTGKTTVCRCFLEQVPKGTHIALLLNPPLNETELLQAICDEFGIEYPAEANVNQLTALLNRFLLKVHADGEGVMVIVEEAQHLDFATLERLRLLTNLETDERKLMQVVLIGQPELLAVVARPGMSQLAQRIIARYHLRPLHLDDMEAYLQHRLKVSGGDISLFPEAVRLLLFKLSKGIPRLINLICDRALLGCYAQDKMVVDVRTIRDAAKEVLGDSPVGRPKTPWKHFPENPENHLSQVSPVRRWSGVAASVILVLTAGYWILARTDIGGYIRAESPTTNEVVATGMSPGNTPGAGVVADAATLNNHTNVAGAIKQANGQANERGGKNTDSGAHSPPASPGDKMNASNIATSAPVAPAATTQAQSLKWEDVLDGGFAAKAAYQSVLDAWGAGAIPSGITPCEYANQQGLDCWSGDTPLEVLERINRPSVIKMLGRDGRAFYVALLSLNGRYAVIRAGEYEVRVNYEQFKKTWGGEHTILWRRPLAYVDTLKPGYKGTMLPWLSEKLARVNNAAVREVKVYDRAVSRMVRKVQRECGLLVDGLMGRETLIMLNSLTEDVPLLSKARKRLCGRKLS